MLSPEAAEISATYVLLLQCWASPTSSIGRRISLSFVTSRLATKTKRNRSSLQPVGHAVGFPRTISRSSSPSPTPSLDIRMPNGLGRRASEELNGEIFVPSDLISVPQKDERVRSLSTPNPPRNDFVKWNEVLSSLQEEVPSGAGPVISRISSEIFKVVFSFALRADIASLALVSRAFLTPALHALYSNLDLRDLDSRRVNQCISLLASKKALAGFVRNFACRVLPSSKDSATSFYAVTFAIAFANMYQLVSLTISRFDVHLLFHATFRLRRLTILSEAISPDEFPDLTAWLVRQPSILSLSLPNFVISTHTDYPINDSSNNGHTDTSNTHTLRSHTTLCLFPPHLLSRLTHFHGPAAIVPTVISGRPVRSVVLHIHNTLYDGLKPSAIMSALASSGYSLKQLSIKAASSRIDARTLERVFMSVGAELGGRLEVLEVQWVLEDEILYKQLHSALPRFRTLRTVRLYRRSPPPPPSSPPPTAPLPPTSPLPSSSTLSVPSSPISIRSRPNSAQGFALDIPLPRAHERSHLGSWSKYCPSLRTVVFLSGAEWHIKPYPLVGRNSVPPSFVFVGLTA
ncbi:hypothetical protein AcW1_002968 [Taiwanofungus camphoratus]|nr:hypothetical protein AcW1_002968 [Antrodia cinnamomea]